MRHFWVYEPFNTWSLGIQSPLSIPGCLDVPRETRLLACSRLRDGRTPGIEKARRRKTGGSFFPAPPSFSRAFHFRVFDTPSRLPHYKRAWNRLPSCDVKRTSGDLGNDKRRLGLQVGYSTCCCNIFGKRVMFSITVGIISSLNWLFCNPLIA